GWRSSVNERIRTPSRARVSDARNASVSTFCSSRSSVTGSCVPFPSVEPIAKRAVDTTRSAHATCEADLEQQELRSRQDAKHLQLPLPATAMISRIVRALAGTRLA